MSTIKQNKLQLMMANLSTKKVLLWAWGIFLGLSLGLLTTLIFIIGVRAALSAIFGSDGGPDWLYQLLFILTIATMIIASFISTKWSIRVYIKR